MQASRLLPFRRLTKPKSADPAGDMKAGFFLLFTGFSSHILFFEVLVLIMKLDTNYMQSLLFLGVTGLPELDILTPLIIIVLSPILLIFTNPLLFLVSELPWVFSGFLTGIYFGPQHDRSIMFAPPIFMGSIMILFLFFIYTLAGLGQFSPFVSILILIFTMLSLFVIGGQLIFILSMIIVIPALIGYYFGKKNTPSAVSPRVFLAQPDRQDPKNTRCRFLDSKNNCFVSGKESVFFSNICDNKWNQVTCSYYLRRVKAEKSTKKSIKGDNIFETQ